VLTETYREKRPPLGGSCAHSDDVTRTKVTGRLEPIDHHIVSKFETCAPKGTDARAVEANRDI
jgi:hypothetical protein